MQTQSQATNDSGSKKNANSNKSKTESSHASHEEDSDVDSLVDLAFEAIQKFWMQVQHVASFVMTELGGYEIFDAIAVWCMRNPHIAIILFVIGIVFLLPFLIIFGFGIFTMVMTFTGILVLEGTLLTVVSIMFFACLGGLAVIVVLSAVVIVAAYLGFLKVYGSCEDQKVAIFNFVQKYRNSKSSTAGIQQQDESNQMPDAK